MTRPHSWASLIAFGAASVLAAPPPEWPGFRGLGQGVTHETGLPERWGASSGLAWKAAVPGAGWSSPIVAGGRVFLTTATDEGTSCPCGAPGHRHFGQAEVQVRRQPGLVSQMPGKPRAPAVFPRPGC